MNGSRSHAQGFALIFVALLHVIVGYLAITGSGKLLVARAAQTLQVAFIPQARAMPPEIPRTVLPAPKLATPPAITPIVPTIDIVIAGAITPEPVPARASAIETIAASDTTGTTRDFQPPRGDLAYLSNPAPAYPSLSRRMKEEGRVLLRVHVDERGHVVTIEIASSSGFARLDQAATAAVRQWRFVPARAGRVPVAGWATVPISFQLEPSST